MTRSRFSAIQKWHELAAARDPSALGEILSPDVVFESPVVHTPQVGREITAKYLAGALMVLGNENFRYTGEWENDTGTVLEFATEIDGIAVNGVDIITVNADGSQITGFKVMIRPLKAVNLVHAMMGAALTKAG